VEADQHFLTNVLFAFNQRTFYIFPTHLFYKLKVVTTHI